MAATELLRQPRATDGCTAICAHRKPSPWKFLLRQVSVWSEDADLGRRVKQAAFALEEHSHLWASRPESAIAISKNDHMSAQWVPKHTADPHPF